MHVSSFVPSKKEVDKERSMLVLNDLLPKFPVEHTPTISKTKLKVVLEWLATFHAFFWERTKVFRSVRCFLFFCCC